MPLSEHSIRLRDLIEHPGTVWTGVVISIDRRVDDTDIIVQWDNVERWGGGGGPISVTKLLRGPRSWEIQR